MCGSREWCIYMQEDKKWLCIPPPAYIAIFCRLNLNSKNLYVAKSGVPFYTKSIRILSSLKLYSTVHPNSEDVLQKKGFYLPENFEMILQLGNILVTRRNDQKVRKQILPFKCWQLGNGKLAVAANYHPHPLTILYLK